MAFPAAELRQTAEAVRESQISLQLSRMEEVMASLSREVGNLVEALSPVSRSEPMHPETAKHASVPVEALVPVAARLRDFNSRAQEILCCVNDARNRLEI